MYFGHHLQCHRQSVFFRLFHLSNLLGLLLLGRSSVFRVPRQVLVLLPSTDWSVNTMSQVVLPIFVL